MPAASSPPGPDERVPASAPGSDGGEASSASPQDTPSAAGLGFASVASGGPDAGGAGQPQPSAAAAAAPSPRKGPLSFLSGALTSGLLAWLCLGLSQKVVAYYGAHPPHYTAQIAQSIATALKTLIVGMCFLATFSFAFIGLGLTLTFVRSLLPGRTGHESS